MKTSSTSQNGPETVKLYNFNPQQSANLQPHVASDIRNPNSTRDGMVYNLSLQTMSCLGLLYISQNAEYIYARRLAHGRCLDEGKPEQNVEASGFWFIPESDDAHLGVDGHCDEQYMRNLHHLLTAP